MLTAVFKYSSESGIQVLWLIVSGQIQRNLSDVRNLQLHTLLFIAAAAAAAAAVASVVSDSMRPHRRKPTRLPCPWDSPGKNTGVGCHFLLQCMKVKSESEVAQLCLTLLDPMDCSLPGFSVHGSFQARVLESTLPFPLLFISQR